MKYLLALLAFCLLYAAMPHSHAKLTKSGSVSTTPVKRITPIRKQIPPRVRPEPRPSLSPSSASTTGSLMSTRASWYDVRPTMCYDRSKAGTKAHEVDPTITLWTAHKTLPCGTLVRVSYEGNTTIVPVWDRGPYHIKRDLDLSLAAFKQLAPSHLGVIKVDWSVVR